MSNDTVMIAIPAWNESASIQSVIEKVHAEVPGAHVVVINDGSTDNTAELAEQAGAVTLTLPFNVGVGGAMRTAFLYASRNGIQALVQVDADGQHDPTDLPKLLEALNEADIVVGSRFHTGSTYVVKGPRRWAMSLLSASMSRAAGTTITDTTSGFRAAGPKAIALFAVNYPADYLGDTLGSLAIGIRSGLTVTERPVTMYYREHGSPSKNAIWSALYLGRASLALIATGLRKGDQSRGDSA